jgi:asparagine synthase (glutamine-hydrolysing)
MDETIRAAQPGASTFEWSYGDIMCGICGKLNFDPEDTVDPAVLQRMMDVISHRGPDGSGAHRAGPVALGHRRLSIIDLNTGNQPMSNEDGTVWVVYNGEIYNFPELRAELQTRGHHFKSTTDTEVIVHLYEEIGTECVVRLRGMFAFALWDGRTQTLLLARDRVGIKPLYYTNTGKALVFGSEIKSVIADPAIVRRVNPRAIDRFITYYYLPGNETLLQGIYKLRPGHYLTVNRGTVAEKQYWDLHFAAPENAQTFENAVESLQALLRQTVQDHMISDVPVGVLLSGGIDSTAVLRYAAEHAGTPLHTFTIGFTGEGFADERPYARIAAQRYGTRHQEITITANDFRDFLPKYAWHMEEPVCEPPAVALYFVSRLARQSSVKVLLSGEGGDEAFGGYQTYRNLLFLEGLKSALGSAKPLLRFAFQLLSRVGWGRIAPYGALVGSTLPQYYLSRTATPQTPFNRLKRGLYIDGVNDAIGEGVSDEPTRRLFEETNGYTLLDRMLYVDTKSWLPDDLLVKADKMTMATSVELRVPLLDFQVLEFAASLPQSFKVRGWSTKRILKAALQQSVPTEIVKRKKTGFPVPYNRWLRTDLNAFVTDALLGPGAALASYFRKEVIEGILARFNRDGVGGKEVFSLLALELWHQQFLGTQSP